MRIVQIIDSHNFFHTVKMKFDQDAKVDFRKIYKERSVVVGFESKGFENFLRTNKYEVHLIPKSGDNFSLTALLIAEAIRIPCDYLVLGTQDKLIVPFVDVMRGKGVFVEVLGAGIHTDLRTASNKWTEIELEHLC